MWKIWSKGVRTTHFRPMPLDLLATGASCFQPVLLSVCVHMGVTVKVFFDQFAIDFLLLALWISLVSGQECSVCLESYL